MPNRKTKRLKRHQKYLSSSQPHLKRARGLLTGKRLIVFAIVAFGVIGVWMLYRSYAADTTFKHPGILVSKSQLDFVKGKIAAGEEPWTSSFNRMKSSSLASKTYTPSPVPKLMCSTKVGLNEGFPQAGCTEMNRDSSAAYVQSLMYYFTGDVTYANNTAKILNAWTSTLKEIPYDQPRTTNGEPAYWQNLLVVGWSTQTMTRGAEIIRYTSSSLGATDASRADNWYKNLIYPYLNSYTAGGSANGGQTWTEALINIGIFTNDRSIYDKGIAWYRIKSPQLVYLTSDGAKPPLPTDANTTKPTYGTVDQRWSYPTRYVNGHVIETCRDLGHTFMGLGGYANIAETVLVQGTHDLYAENQDRFLAAFELNTGYVNQMLDQMTASGQTASQVTASTWQPANFPCSDFKDGGGSAFLGTELAYNHFVNRRGKTMPNTKRLIDRTRPQAGGNHLLYEALTHANTGSAGIVAAQPVPVDSKPPTVTITSPKSAQILSGVVTLSATASDESGIQKVDFKVNSNTVASKTAAPYTHSLDTKTLVDGGYSISAVAYDIKGNTSTSTVTVNIKNQVIVTPPPPPPSDTQAPTAPTGLSRQLVTNWGKFRYDLRLTWRASTDNVGIKDYVVSRNGSQIGTINADSFVDSTLSAGTLYTYTIVARDAAGNTSGPATTTAKASCFLFWCNLE